MFRLILLTAFSLIIPISGLFSAEAAGNIIILRHDKETILLIEQDENINQPPRLEINLSGSGIITLYSGEQTEKLQFATGEEGGNIYIHPGTAGIFPEQVSFTDTDYNFDLYSVNIFRSEQAEEPLPADIGHIIFSDFNSSRNEQWEIYRWNLIPNVLIFDTADYGVQSRLFKRLAFFVEKPGFTGTLVSNKNLNGRHGWNAHDYRADDLAAFFTKAKKENFELNPEELVLRKVLSDLGIIINSGEKYLPGEGAVLSVSRETSSNWRYRFLTHECLHGLFFTNENYRRDIEAVFTGLAPAEVDFWKHLLDYRQYDVRNRYLLINEFMAYSLQQPIDEVDDYFKGFLYVKMTAARPWETPFVNNFEQNHSASFRNTVKQLGSVLKAYTDRNPGHLANLYPEKLSESFFNLFPPAE